jgi:hypothetical protein
MGKRTYGLNQIARRLPGEGPGSQNGTEQRMKTFCTADVDNEGTR